MELRDGQHWGRVPSTSDLRSLLPKTEIDCQGREERQRWEVEVGGGGAALRKQGHTLHPPPPPALRPVMEGNAGPQRGRGGGERGEGGREGHQEEEVEGGRQVPHGRHRDKGEREADTEALGIRDVHR